MTNIAQGQTLEIGPHRARFEPPDVIRVRWQGSMNADVFDTLFQWSDELLGGARHFVISDMTHLDTVSPSARKAAATDPRSPRIAGIAIVGASAHMRALMGLFLKALELMYGEGTFRRAFFDSEDEALAWVNAQRAELGPASQAGSERARFAPTSG
ncbi:STAS/SEC14 domain-containing protein [Polyangium sp. 6x1]|uniref:STAS/SEC14 domain-containing protein n=1 Tax=Polyangium sp. 6x1 TaxID=3042689 RepID=UPI002482FCB4|nr:STAS/SEC14 domain-containing protein [Polyangium sp. 6x1]MDI1450985.1 STAS/SEC14 domain-containing protein [Polyangium sp. 6x1]